MSGAGFVQFVSSMAVAEVIRKDGSILNYLRRVARKDAAPLHVAEDVMNNYIKSCGASLTWHAPGYSQSKMGHFRAFIE